MSKRNKKTKNSSHLLTYIAWTLAFVTVILASLAIGYYVGFNDAQAQAKEDISYKEKKDKHYCKNSKMQVKMKRKVSTQG